MGRLKGGIVRENVRRKWTPLENGAWSSVNNEESICLIVNTFGIRVCSSSYL